MLKQLETKEDKPENEGTFIWFISCSLSMQLLEDLYYIYNIASRKVLFHS